MHIYNHEYNVQLTKIFIRFFVPSASLLAIEQKIAVSKVPGLQRFLNLLLIIVIYLFRTLFPMPGFFHYHIDDTCQA